VKTIFVVLIVCALALLVGAALSAQSSGYAGLRFELTQPPVQQALKEWVETNCTVQLWPQDARRAIAQGGLSDAPVPLHLDCRVALTK
jgi:hypothetical protein